MIYNNICSNGLYGFGPETLTEFGRAQFGDFAPKLVQSLRVGLLHWTSEYSWHFQRNLLTRTKEVWCHSRFAAHKLLFESRIAPSELPKFRVVGHPRMPASHIESRASGMFVLGCFGWVQRSKRVHVVLKALSVFLSALPDDARSKVQLNVVGAVEDQRYQPGEMADALGISSNVETYGYVDQPTMERLMGECSLIFNLRFPSCGETSGTSQRATDSFIPVVSSAYQAFRELPVDHHVSVDPRTEVTELVSILKQHYRRWDEAGGAFPSRSERSVMPPGYTEIAYVIKDRLFESGETHG